jgi:hypothetical protein
MSDRLLAAYWEGSVLVRSWRSRQFVRAGPRWLALTIESMWLCGEHPGTTVTATWNAEPNIAPQETTAPIWKAEGVPARTDLLAGVLASAQRLDIAEREPPATHPSELHDLFEATCAARLWQTVHSPITHHRASRVGLIGTHPETQLAIEFPTPNGLEELRSDIWQEPARPAANADALADELWIRFMEGG